MSKSIPTILLADSDFLLSGTENFDRSPLLISGPTVDDDEKIKIIERHFKIIMETLGLDLTDDSLKETPKRIAKMFVKEIFSGLNPANKPAISLFDNSYQ